MEKVTQRDLIRAVAKRWCEQYGEREPAILTRLESLDLETATCADVAEIIGNEFWTIVGCDECQRTCDAVIRLGEAPGESSRTAFICGPCLAKATEMIK